MAATLLTITDLAARLESDPRTTRKFLRSITPADEQPGKGSRWAVPATKVQSLKAKYRKFQEAAAEAKAAKEATDDDAVTIDDTVIAEVEHHDITD